MAASPAPSPRRSPASSAASLKRSRERPSRSASPPAAPVDTLVNHLLAAKRSLSSMTLVLRANDLATSARRLHEDAAVLAAQARFLRAAVLDQAALLVRVRRSLQVTYDWGKRDFKRLVKAMDEVDAELGDTMEMLRGTDVQAAALRLHDGEDRKNLLDFVDEASVHGMRDAMKKSIEELQGIQQSFDGDLLRFDTDIRNLKKVIVEPPAPQGSGDDEAPHSEATELLFSMADHSSNMGQLLASLTTHFDMCVTAVRATDGAAALARRRAAEATQSQGSGGADSVSISGVIAEHESGDPSDLAPKTAADRAEMLKVVVQDADEVDDVVREIQDRLVAVERDYARLRDLASAARAAHLGMLAAHAALEDMGDRLGDYLAAEDDFRGRWDLERDAVFAKLRDMRQMRGFYEGYAGAYDGLVLEAERRRAVADRVDAVWRKARDAVDRIIDADRAARDAFRQDVGEFLPTDLWAGMQGPTPRWEVVQVAEGAEGSPARGGDAREGSADAKPEAKEETKQDE